MEVADLTEVKNNLSRYIDQVQQGVRVRILVHGVPVADLVPVAAAELLQPGPVVGGTALSGLLVAERREGR
jgi:prevent-host-death family protein